MKKKSKNKNGKVDYFELWEEPENKSKLKIILKNKLEEESISTKKKLVKIIHTPVMLARRAEIKETKDVIQLLQVESTSINKIKTQEEKKYRQDELIHCSGVLKVLVSA